MPRSSSSAGVISVPFSKRSESVSRFTTSNSSRKMLLKPRFGTRRCSGIWPPSNPRLCLKPERDFAPLCPRPAVLPLPDPWPRPIRFFACLAPFGGRRLERFIIRVSVNSLRHNSQCPINSPVPRSQLPLHLVRSCRLLELLRHLDQMTDL